MKIIHAKYSFLNPQIGTKYNLIITKIMPTSNSICINGLKIGFIFLILNIPSSSFWGENMFFDRFHEKRK